MSDGDGAPACGEEPQLLSKNAVKRALKIRRQEEERRLAAAARGAPAAAAADEDDMDPNKYYEHRLKTVASLKDAGVDVYPPKFPLDDSAVLVSVSEYVEKYKSLGQGEKLVDVTEYLAGRIMSKRSSSSKLFFYDLCCEGDKVQVMADARLF